MNIYIRLIVCRFLLFTIINYFNIWNRQIFSLKINKTEISAGINYSWKWTWSVVVDRYFRTKIWIIIEGTSKISLFNVYSRNVCKQHLMSRLVHQSKINLWYPRFHSTFRFEMYTHIYISIFCAGQEMICCSKVTELRHEKRVINFLFTKDRLRKWSRANIPC